MLRLVVWLLLLAAVLYAVFWSIDRRTGGGASERPTPRRSWAERFGGGASHTGPLGPDDDEEFLRELERRRREER